VVTSPPYWGLRDYGVAKQIGLEKSPQAYVQELVEVFREVRHVLRSDGTLWLNLGDSYAGSGRGGNPDAGTKQGTNKGSQSVGVLYGREHESATTERARIKAQTDTLRSFNIKPKDLVGIPWRVAFALQQDGWYLRQDIIWAKPNPMPESVTDRCTKAHEYLFLLSKSGRYYFDQEGIAEPAVKAGLVLHSYGTAAKDRQDVSETNDRRTRIGLANWNQAQPDTRNKRSVWEVCTAPFAEAHFATFPPALIEPCIKAGCPKGGTVLDPFGGAGTTGLVADRNGRNAILVELNPEYATMAERRIQNDGGLFSEVANV
jgi:DNA modification methylase